MATRWPQNARDQSAPAPLDLTTVLTTTGTIRTVTICQYCRLEFRRILMAEMMVLALVFATLMVSSVAMMMMFLYGAFR
jgi:hypothetical protein